MPTPLDRIAYRVVAATALFMAAAFSTTNAQTVRDSAGARIVENAQPLLSGAGAPRLANAPLLELDPTKGADYTFGRVIGALRLADGRVFVAGRTAPHFRLFDRNGRLLHAVEERTTDQSNDEGHSIARVRGDTIAVLYRRKPTVLVVAPVTPADWEHWVTDWSKLWVKERGADSLKEVQSVRESPYAFELPAFSGCLVAQDRTLWVREAHLDDAISAGSLNDDPLVASKWSVFNPEGRWISDVTMPAGFMPTDIGTDYVAGRLRRAPGRMTVVVYRLSPDAR